MAVAVQIQSTMTVKEFLAWNAPSGPPWQLVDGEPRAMAPTSRTHGRIQARLGGLLDAFLTTRAGGSTVITTPGVLPRVRLDSNFRIPDLATTYDQEEAELVDPVVLIEILSPSKQAETWTNVWAYTTIPSVQEILIVHSTAIRAELLRRDTGGNWPERALTIDDGVLELQSIGFAVDLLALYQGTRLASA